MSTALHLDANDPDGGKSTARERAEERWESDNLRAARLLRSVAERIEVAIYGVTLHGDSTKQLDRLCDEAGEYLATLELAHHGPQYPEEGE